MTCLAWLCFFFVKRRQHKHYLKAKQSVPNFSFPLTDWLWMGDWSRPVCSSRSWRGRLASVWWRQPLTVSSWLSIRLRPYLDTGRLARMCRYLKQNSITQNQSMFIRLLKNMLRENLLEKGNLCMYLHSLDVGISTEQIILSCTK